jgi:hypothetical protein
MENIQVVPGKFKQILHIHKIEKIVNLDLFLTVAQLLWQEVLKYYQEIFLILIVNDVQSKHIELLGITLKALVDDWKLIWFVSIFQ